MNYLGVQGGRFLVCGLANRRSVAWHVGQALMAEGASVVYTVHSEERRRAVEDIAGGAPVYVCDAERPEAFEDLAAVAGSAHGPFAGLVHSIAYARYSGKAFHETRREDFLQAALVSAFSLVELARALRPHLEPGAGVVAVSISSLTVTPAAYGLMSPVKAALEGIVRHLAKSYSGAGVRFNTVNAGPLRTRSAAGIPGYMDNYLYAEKLTFRKKALETREVADAVLFLLSRRASGINGAGLTVDAGHGLNGFDEEVVRLATRPHAL